MSPAVFCFKGFLRARRLRPGSLGRPAKLLLDLGFPDDVSPGDVQIILERRHKSGQVSEHDYLTMSGGLADAAQDFARGIGTTLAILDARDWMTLPGGHQRRTHTH